MLSCNKSTNSANSGGTGKGGSLARFTIASNHLYTLTNSKLHVYDISDALNPLKKQVIELVGPETIFPFQNQLFIGSATGMYIFSIADPAKPVLLSRTTHLRSCDPVVTNGQYAFSTLRGGTTCGAARSGLYVYNVTNITQPVLKQTIDFSTPFGLGLHNNTLYLCGGQEGLVILDITDPVNPVKKSTLNNEEYLDVIINNNLLVCYVKSGLILYDISNAFQPVELTRLNS